MICTHGVGTPLIIVDFDVVIIDTLVGFDVSHRQSGSRGGTHSASLRSALLPSSASSLPRELVSGRHLPLPEAVGRPRPPRLPDCLSVHGVGSEDGLAVQTEDFTTFVE